MLKGVLQLVKEESSGESSDKKISLEQQGRNTKRYYCGKQARPGQDLDTYVMSRSRTTGDLLWALRRG